MQAPPHVDVLVEHVRRALVHELGTRSVETWLGKDGAFRHDVADLARIAVDALTPVIDDGLAERVLQLHSDGILAPPLRIDPNDW
ncbi:MAG TPA: hypothetical protein VE575_10565 [Acidimicrobiales bacterium]|jgi:hypothetical protein|nr:hypothetical protein [Acidimicrobiales bacterium]